MDFLNYAQITIPVLSGINMTVWDKENQPLEEFERQFCFLEKVQPIYTSKGLLSFFKSKSGQHIYVVSDMLDTNASIIKIDNKWVILGPYVTTEWKEYTAKTILGKCGGGDAMLPFYKLYRCRLPVLTQEYVIRITMLLLTNTVENASSYELEPIGISAHDDAVSKANMSEIYEDFEIVNRRYELEILFGNAISAGNTSEALHLLDELRKSSAGLRFLTSDMLGQLGANVFVRTLVRHAALRAGLTPIQIDAISQEYAQKVSHATNLQQLRCFEEQNIIAFCHLIRNSKKSNYSPYVKRALQYIETHLNQTITIDSLCRLNDISRQYFVRLFSKETGKTVQQYIMNARCERAAELIENSQLSIHEVAHYVGYDDANYFTRVFRHVIGQSPQEYRKNKKIF